MSECPKCYGNDGLQPCDYCGCNRKSKIKISRKEAIQLARNSRKRIEEAMALEVEKDAKSFNEEK